jgi:hypothetical protein
VLKILGRAADNPLVDGVDPRRLDSGVFMIRALGLQVAFIGCLAISTTAMAEPPRASGPTDASAGATRRETVTPTLQRAVSGARSPAANLAGDTGVTATKPDFTLPPRIQAVCAKAKGGDLVFMCGEFERLYRQTEAQNLEAAKKLHALTKGGVIEVLQ